jgi:hypothetical protein
VKKKTNTSRDACIMCGEPTGGPWPACSESCWWLLETGDALARELEPRYTTGPEGLRVA